MKVFNYVQDGWDARCANEIRLLANLCWMMKISTWCKLWWVLIKDILKAELDNASSGIADSQKIYTGCDRNAKHNSRPKNTKKLQGYCYSMNKPRNNYGFTSFRVFAESESFTNPQSGYLFSRLSVLGNEFHESPNRTALTSDHLSTSTYCECSTSRDLEVTSIFLEFVSWDFVFKGTLR